MLLFGLSFLCKIQVSTIIHGSEQLAKKLQSNKKNVSDFLCIEFYYCLHVFNMINGFKK